MEFNLHRDFPQDLKADWNQLVNKVDSPNPFMQFEWLETWWQTLGGGEWQEASLFIITAHQNKELVGAAPLFLIEREGKNVLQLIGSYEVFDYLDFLYASGSGKEFIEGLLDFLLSTNEINWDVLDLYNLVEKSTTIPLLNMAADAKGLGVKEETLQTCPYIELPDSFDDYLSGIKKKQRHEIRRKVRRFEELEGQNDWYIINDASDLPEAADAFLHLMEQNNEKNIFLTDAMREFIRSMIEISYNMGQLRLMFVDINGEKAAAKMIFEFDGRWFAYNSGIHPDTYQHSPGWVLLAYLLEDAINKGIPLFDFMRGNEEYKYRFGSVDAFLKRLTITR